MMETIIMTVNSFVRLMMELLDAPQSFSKTVLKLSSSKNDCRLNYNEIGQKRKL